MDNQANYRLDKEMRDLINRSGVRNVLTALLRWYDANSRVAEETEDSIKFMVPPKSESRPDGR